ncbi:hypothetical protein EZV62_001121 [Acer yangbiense]|uniref:Uncharacterized protein n=1 Tax=Acer yangbiense TaxID=1000413 RepID=A0A5C7IVJ3_9ROSI|nr:hypothetical protein EZV62_001121 [Acer yangbiense]
MQGPPPILKKRTEKSKEFDVELHSSNMMELDWETRSREGAERFGSIFEGDLFGGVDGGNGVDDDGRGKEVKDPKEGEVTDLEEPEEDPFRGNSIGEVVSFGGIELDVVEVFVLKRIFK